MAHPQSFRRLLAALSLLCLFFSYAAAAAAPPKPNIVVILTDDQDLHLNSLELMENLQSMLVQQGTIFSKHYGHVSLCCPARTTLWTGKHAHNTNVTSVTNGLPGGAWQQVQALGWYKKYLFTWMQAAGYSTYYSGKLFNGYSAENYCEPHCLEGLSSAHVLLDPSMYKYYNSSWTSYDGHKWTVDANFTGYNTDQITEDIADYIHANAHSGKPFFAVAAPVAPHVPTIPKHEYKDLYPGLQVPRSPNWNPANRSGVATVWTLDQLDDQNIEELDDWYRRRQQCLKSVDDMIATVVQTLEEEGVLDNTYIFYTTDNGFHMGNHRLQGGKTTCYEEDINLPFIVRGPGVAKNQSVTDLVTGHIDLAPTILTLAQPDWAGFVVGGDEWDGTAITFPLETAADVQRNVDARSDSTHIEYWGPFQQEGVYGAWWFIGQDHWKNVNTYKSLRIQGAGYNLMYSVWCQDSAHELYDMSWDQYQMTNLHPYAPSEGNTTNAYDKGMTTVLGRPIWNVLHRLDALVLILKTCASEDCRWPWKQLHPEGGVNNLMDALDAQYDAFYAHSYAVAKVGWEQCYTGLLPHASSTLYAIENEQPVWLNQTVVKMVRNDGERLAVGAKWLALLLGWGAYLAFA